jgi:NAD(P)H dehydrogenase (quinone)
MTTIAVTGATGQLGGRVAHRLHAAGLSQRLLVRDPTRAPQIDDAEVAVASYSDPHVSAALAGVQTLLMVSAAESPERVQQHRDFVDSAADAGVEHIVYVSFVGASPNATFTLARDHWDTEEHIKASGMAHTFLRDNIYADLFPYLAGEDGVLRGPAAQGRIAAVARDDIADVAATVLRSPDTHVGKTYELTGPEALTFDDVAGVLTYVTGRRVTYEPETVEDAYASRRALSSSEWQLDAWVTTYTAIAAGELAALSTAVPDLTGHPATSLETLLRES